MMNGRAAASAVLCYAFVGHYVPQLAELIYDGNKAASRDRAISIKGFMVSTGCLTTSVCVIKEVAIIYAGRIAYLLGSRQPALTQQIRH
jgi:hypothetical protein